MNGQLSDFLSILKGHHLDGFIVTNPINIFYLTGFRGISPTERESLLIFSPRPLLIVPRLYQGEAQTLASANLRVKIVSERNQIFQLARKLLKSAKKVGFEEEDLKYSEFKEFQKALPQVKLVPIKALIENLRTLKTEEEIKRIKKAQIISQKAFWQLLKTLKVGQTEGEIADNLAKIIKNLGGEGLAFESIVAAGRNAALPHYKTGKKQIKKGEVLLFDFGAKYQDYCADLSRTVFVGRARDHHKNIYLNVQNAQKNALSKITHGLKASEAFFLAKSLFRKQKLDKYFLHSLGHGIGLEVHEKPYLRPTIDEELQEGMVFSVEPGLYFPDWGGIRIEDLVVIKNGKAQVLGGVVDQLIEIG